MQRKLQNMQVWLQGLSFRTGLVVFGCCVLCYLLSFGQMLLPISTTSKTALWVLFFGLAKTFQYTALLILGKEGLKYIKNRLLLKKKL